MDQGQNRLTLENLAIFGLDPRDRGWKRRAREAQWRNPCADEKADAGEKAVVIGQVEKGKGEVARAG